MLEFYIKCNSTEIRDGKSNNVIGRWHDGYAIHMKYNPVADANFITLCEKNELVESVNRLEEKVNGN